MSQCLSDDDIAALALGEADEAARQHARACLACAARQRQAQRDLDAIASVLRARPDERPAVRRRRWAVPAVAAALAGVALALAATELRAPREHAPAPSAASHAVDAETSAFLDRVSAVLSGDEPALPGAPAAGGGAVR